MKTLTKAVAAASLATLSGAVVAGDLALTAGGVSEYYFRGQNLGDAGAYASVDYTSGGFYAGIWTIDDGDRATDANTLDASGNITSGNADGLEYDIYFGYGGELGGGFGYSVGYTRYEYTYSSVFQQEINLGGSIAGFGLDLAFGEDDQDGDEGDYFVIELTYSSGPWGFKIARIDSDEGDDGALNDDGELLISESEQNWAEISYSADFAEGLAGTVTLGQVFGSETDNVDNSSEGNNYLVFDISKSFDL